MNLPDISFAPCLIATLFLFHEGSATATDGDSDEVDSGEQSEHNLNNYCDWFRPTLIRWLQMSRGRTLDRIRRAVELDKAKAVDDIVKHTSSAVDTIGCLNGISRQICVLFLENIVFCLRDVAVLTFFKVVL